MLEREQTLSAYCTGLAARPVCSHGRTLDLVALIAKVGEEVDLYSAEVQRHFICKRCGRRGATFICGQDSRWSSPAGRDEIAAEDRRTRDRH
jgi:hypothetical protein